MKQVGVDPASALLRLPLQMRYPLATGAEGMDFVAPRLPAPWHVAVALLRAKGLAREDKMALARFSTTARWMGWQLQDCSVAELLQRYEQTPRLIRLMWRPLCIAALNTPPERALGASLPERAARQPGRAPRASDMLLPRVDLGALLPDAAAAYLGKRGGLVQAGVAVARLLPGNDEGSWRLEDRAAEAWANSPGWCWPPAPTPPRSCWTACMTRRSCRHWNTNRSPPVTCSTRPACACRPLPGAGR
jgi:hypothetical protein